MRLRRLQRDWDALGHADPMWAILTDDEHRGGKWDPEAFYQAGRDEIDSALAEARRLKPDLRSDSALDFGCGIGRISFALASHFDQVIGVDIAPSMIAAARERSKHLGVDSCRFEVNDRADLQLIDTASVDLVYSRLVLQHIPTAAAIRYVAEFVRVLRPGGLAWFQAPSRRRRDGLARYVPAAVLRPVQWGRARLTLAGKERVYPVPRHLVESTVREAGGTILDITDDDAFAGAWDSYRYAVTK